MLVRYTDLVYEPPFPRAEEPRFPKLPSKIRIRQPVLGMQRAIVAFLQSTWAGTPQISISDPTFLGLLPVADLDDDGYCDATERAAGSDPYVTSSVPAGVPDCARDLGFTR